VGGGEVGWAEEVRKIKMKHKIKTKLSCGSQRGVSALELTILAPLIFVLVFGMIEFGCLFYDKLMITNASREGARAGIVFIDDEHNTLDNNITTRVTEAVNKYLRKDDDTGWRLIYFGSPTPDPEIPSPTISASAHGNDRLRVEVRWTYDFLVLPNFKNLGWVDLSDTITINAVNEMMLQENPA
jgi:hypothetical protein